MNWVYIYAFIWHKFMFMFFSMNSKSKQILEEFKIILDQPETWFLLLLELFQLAC